MSLGRVLYIAAHPDDENTRLIAYWANGALYDAAYLSLTRGDGGQNLIGPELRDQLGVIRTQELLAARRIDHGRQFFTRANDFGFSKSPEETLRIWDREKILADVVWVIRKFRPDLVVTRFPTEDSDTHGHHTASARLAAGSVSRGGGSETFSRATQVCAAVATEPVALEFVGRFPRAVAQRAIRSDRFDQPRSRRLSTAPRQVISRDRRGQPEHAQKSGIRRRDRARRAKGIFQISRRQADRKWRRDLRWYRHDLGACSRSDRCQRRRSTRSSRTTTQRSPSRRSPRCLNFGKRCVPWAMIRGRQEKRSELDSIIAACLGLHLEAVAEKPAAQPGAKSGASGRGNQSLAGGGETPIAARVDERRGHASRKVLVPNEVFIQKTTIALPKDLPFSQPYWLRQPGTVGTYAVSDQTLIGRPENPPTVSCGRNAARSAARRSLIHWSLGFGRWIGSLAK